MAGKVKPLDQVGATCSSPACTLRPAASVWECLMLPTDAAAAAVWLVHVAKSALVFTQNTFLGSEVKDKGRNNVI